MNATTCPTICIDPAIVDSYGLSPLAGWLYVVIARHINRDSGEGFPTVVRLAQLANMSRASVIRYIKELEDKKLIKVTRRNNGNRNENNVYELLTDTSEVSQSDQRSITEIPEAAQVLVSDVDRKQVLKNKEHKATTVAGATEQVKPSQLRAKNGLYDAIQKIWHYTGALNGLMAKLLMGIADRKGWREYNLETPVSASELLEWAAWYRKTELRGDPNLNMVAEPMKIQSSITYWQGRKAKQAEQQRIRAEADQEWEKNHPDLFRHHMAAAGVQ